MELWVIIVIISQSAKEDRKRMDVIPGSNCVDLIRSFRWIVAVLCYEPLISRRFMYNVGGAITQWFNPVGPYVIETHNIQVCDSKIPYTRLLIRPY